MRDDERAHRETRTSTIFGSLGWIGGVHGDRAGRQSSPKEIVQTEVLNGLRNHARRIQGRVGRRSGLFGAGAALAERELIGSAWH